MLTRLPVARDKLILQPRPSDDPEEPLNWSAARKSVNFGIVCFYALMTFVLYVTSDLS